MEAITGLILSMYFTKWLGEKRDIDPGRPGVPSFGSKIYRLTANPGFVTSINKKEIAILRKRRSAPKNYDLASDKAWSNAYNKFTKKLSGSNIGGVIFDYDGTIVDSNKRWDPPTEDLSKELVRLLEFGIFIGFATGRGKSVRKDLRKVIPDKYWENIIIGFYNGSEIKKLSDNRVLEGTSETTKELSKLYKKLKKNIFLSILAKIEERKYQLTVEKKQYLSETFIWDMVQDEFYNDEEHNGQVLRSSHSIDVIASG